MNSPNFIIVAIVTALIASCSPQEEPTSQEPGGAEAAQATAVAKGRVDVEGGLIAIAAPRDGVITQVYVQEGDRVEQGQLLARQDERVPNAALAEALAARDTQAAKIDGVIAQIASANDEVQRLSGKAGISSSRARLALLQDQLAAAEREFARSEGTGRPDPSVARLASLEVQLSAARREEERLIGLVGQGAETHQALDKARDERQRLESETRALNADIDKTRSEAGDRVRSMRREVDVSRAELARSLVESTARVRVLQSELASGRADLQAANARLLSAQLEVEQRQIRAPVAGIIVRAAARPGVGASTLNVTSLFTLAPFNAKIVRSELEESMVEAVKLGQTVSVKVEGSNRPEIKGKVLRVGQVFGVSRRDDDPNARADDRVIEVVTSIENQSLLIGQRVRVHFLREGKP